MSPMSQSFLSLLTRFKANLAEAKANVNVPSMGTPVTEPTGPSTIPCIHRATATHTLPDGGRMIQCMRCGQQWRTTNTPLLRRVDNDAEINQPQRDPALTRQNQEAQAMLTYRHKKMMEDAVRAAAAAFDTEEKDKTAPVKLDGDRKLKVVS